MTNETGHYIFPSLKNGTYSVEAELQGFKKVVRAERRSRRQHDDARGPDAGGRAAHRGGDGRRPRRRSLQTDRTDTGRIIDRKMVTEMPLAFNRNFQGLLVTVPGATRPHRQHSQFFNSQDSLAVEVNGQPRLANNTLIEGLDNNHKTGLLSVIIPAADALETVSVSTSNYDAEFGRSGGAITNVTLKSGTNDLKGSAFFFGNTEATNASDYFTHLQGADEVRAGRLHAWRPDRARTSSSSSATTSARSTTSATSSARPSRRWRCATAISAPSRNGIYDPPTGDVNGTGRTAFANNQIPAGPHQPDRAQPARVHSRSRTSPARRSARTTTRRPRCARRRPTASTRSSTTR